MVQDYLTLMISQFELLKRPLVEELLQRAQLYTVRVFQCILIRLCQ